MSRFSRITSSKKTRPVQRPIQDLGQRELGLKDRHVVAIAGRAILGGERMGKTRQPFPQQLVDLGGRETVAELLQSSGIGAAQDAVVQSLKRRSLPWPVGA